MQKGPFLQSLDLPIKMFHNSFAVLNHRIIIQIGIRKSLVICTNQLDDGLLLKELKYFEVMLNIFEFWHVWQNVESSLVYANKLFPITQPYFLFLDWHNKTKLVPASFSWFWEKSGISTIAPEGKYPTVRVKVWVGFRFEVYGAIVLEPKKIKFLIKCYCLTVIISLCFHVLKKYTIFFTLPC